MKRTFLGLMLLPLVLSAGLASEAAAEPRVQPSAPAIDGYVARAMEATGLPGMSVVVTHGDQVVRVAGYGRDSANQPVTDQPGASRPRGLRGPRVVDNVYGPW